jgi:hypothetical protein
LAAQPFLILTPRTHDLSHDSHCCLHPGDSPISVRFGYTAAGPRHHSHSCFWVPRDSSYFSTSRLWESCDYSFTRIATRVSQSQNHSYFTTGGLRPISLSWRQATWDSRPAIF